MTVDLEILRDQTFFLPCVQREQVAQNGTEEEWRQNPDWSGQYACEQEPLNVDDCRLAYNTLTDFVKTKQAGYSLKEDTGSECPIQIVKVLKQRGDLGGHHA